MSSAPCPYCGKMPEIELRPEQREIALICRECGLEVSDKKREKCFREWDKNYKEVIEFEED